MRKRIVLLAALVSFILFFVTCKDVGSGNTLHFTLLQTSDIHSHAGGFGASLDYTPDNNRDNDGVMGGYTRIASLIAAVRNERAEEDIPVVVVDSGDFFMGTVYDLAAVDPVSLKFFEMVGYDAITLGNHEFDWSPTGLAFLLSNGTGNGFAVPIIATNMITSDASPADDGIETMVNGGVIVRSLVKDLDNGLRIGMLGIMGPDADSVAPVAAPITFNHDYGFLQDRVNTLRNNEGVDIVILISHGGVTSEGVGDDADIAENVTGIDIIASGHYHTSTMTPFTRGASGTFIFSPGEYGEYVSRLDVTFNTETNQIESTDFTLIPVDDTIQNRTVFETVVEGYESAIDQALAPLGFSLDAPISKVSWRMEITGVSESGLGNMAADAIRAITSTLGTPVDLTDTRTLYHLAVDLYALQMMNAVTGMGLTIIPRDSLGNPIPPQEFMLHRIDSDITPGVQELKEWTALLLYLNNFFPAMGDGIPSAIYGTNGVGMGRINLVNF